MAVLSLGLLCAMDGLPSTGSDIPLVLPRCVGEGRSGGVVSGEGRCSGLGLSLNTACVCLATAGWGAAPNTSPLSGCAMADTPALVLILLVACTVPDCAVACLRAARRCWRWSCCSRVGAADSCEESLRLSADRSPAKNRVNIFVLI